MSSESITNQHQIQSWTMRGRSKSRIRFNGLIVEHTNRKAESQQESVAIDHSGMFEMKCNQKGRSKSRIRSNGLIENNTNWEAESQRQSVVKDQNGMFEMKHTNREAESQQESVIVDQNEMFEMKRSKSRFILNGLIVEHTNWEAESQQESVVRDQNTMVEMKQKDRKKTGGGARRLVNGIFGNGFIVKVLISKQFKCRRTEI